MKILFISNSPINRQTSIGNTFLNLFDGFDAELYSVYSRTGYPDKKIIGHLWPQYYSASNSPYFKQFIDAERWKKMLEISKNILMV